MNFFEVYPFEKISSSDFDDSIARATGLICVFFWGQDCPNCEIAKKVLLDRKFEVDSLNLKWLHANVYEDFDLATRFGLHGIPVFMFFRDGKKLGKISPFPDLNPSSRRSHNFRPPKSEEFVRRFRQSLLHLLKAQRRREEFLFALQNFGCSQLQTSLGTFRTSVRRLANHQQK